MSDVDGMGHAPDTLGTWLRSAREAAGLQLTDVSERTHVRTTYLEALEQGNFEALPEEIYARNFVRLYARSLDLDADEALRRYALERDPWAGVAAAAPEGDEAAEAAVPPAQRRAEAAGGAGPARLGRSATDVDGAAYAGRVAPLRRIPASVGPLLATLVLAGALVGIAVWGFNRLLFQPSQNPVTEAGAPPDDDPGDDLADGAEGGGLAGVIGAEEGAALPEEVTLTVQTDPPGAEVMVDAFPLPGTTPIEGIPVTAREARTIRIELEGYEPYEATHDLSQDQQLQVDLQAAAEADDEAAAAEAEAGDADDGDGLLIEVNEPTWIEVYEGDTRGEGERLLYTTAQPGESHRFDPPVYVHVGNAGGIDITLDGEPQPAMGPGGAVVGQAFGTEP